jgi:hypothetical protein
MLSQAGARAVFSNSDFRQYAQREIYFILALREVKALSSCGRSGCNMGTSK